MINSPLTVNVMLWGTWIGRLSWDADKQLSVFQFTEDYLKCPYDICPTTHRKGTGKPAAFFGKAGESCIRDYLNS